MSIASGFISADWAGVFVTAAGGMIAFGLLIFEMKKARAERDRREEAEVKTLRDLSLERARRVVAWIEPIMWQIEREGVVFHRPGGWKLVVSNDTDDTISNWRAVAIRPSSDFDLPDEVLLEAAVVEHGVIPPRSRFEADFRTDDELERFRPPTTTWERSWRSGGSIATRRRGTRSELQALIGSLTRAAAGR